MEDNNPKRGSGGRGNDRRSNPNGNRPRREQNAPARGSNAQPKFDPHFVSAPEATPLRSAKKAPAAPAAPAIKSAAQPAQNPSAGRNSRNDRNDRGSRNERSDRNDRSRNAGAGSNPFGRNSRGEASRTESSRSNAPRTPSNAPRAPRADSSRRGRSSAVKDEDPGLVLISRRPPQQKFTSFEEYMDAHGGATAPIEDHSDEV